MPTDNNHSADPHDPDTPETRPGVAAPTSERFYDNLNFIRTWQPHELLMLIRQHVDISTVTTDWLIQFREDLDLQV